MNKDSYYADIQNFRESIHNIEMSGAIEEY